jgi:putative endonuclease
VLGGRWWVLGGLRRRLRALSHEGTSSSAPSPPTAHNPPRPTHLGARGERAAHRALKQHGYRLLAKNWRCPYGEIDAIAFDRGGVLCFVEIKAQTVGSGVPPAEEVTPAKQQRLARAAAEFLRRSGQLERPCRFDVVTVVFDAAGRAAAQLLPDAFPAARPYG